MNQKSSLNTNIHSMRQVIINVTSFNFRRIENIWLCSVLFIGNELLTRQDTIIFQEVDDKTLNFLGNIKVVKGAFYDNNDSLLVSSQCLLSSGYTDKGVGVLLGLSGVRKSDNLESVKITR